MGESVRRVVRRIARLGDSGRYEEKEDALDRLEGMDMDGPEDYVARGQCLAQAHRYGTAVVDLEAGAAKDADNPVAHFWLAGVLSTLGRRKGAIGELRETVRLCPDSQEAACALSWELERLGRYGEALEELRRYRNAHPDHGRHLHHIWGRIRGRQGKWRQAYAGYVRSVRLHKPGRGATDLMRRKYRLIAGIRRRAAAMDPEDPDSFLRLGSELQEAGWDKDVADILGTAALMRPDIDTYLAIGEIYGQYLCLTEAIDNYKDGIRRLSDAVPPSSISKLYEALVTDLFKCARRREVLEYGAEAIARGADGPMLRERYYFVRDRSDELSDMDPVTAGWTEPYYLGYPLMPPE